MKPPLAVLFCLGDSAQHTDSQYSSALCEQHRDAQTLPAAHVAMELGKDSDSDALL
jgi:hypothetical protein